MKINKLNKSFIFVLSFIMLSIFVTPTKISAASLTLNGTFEAPIKLDLKMGADAFSDKVLIEHLDDNYYLTFTQVDSSNLADMKLIKNGEVGVMVKTEGNTKAYTYSLSLDDLKKPLDFSVIVTVMNKLVTFSMTIDLDNVKYLSDEIEDRGERPARFIPVISTNATNQEIEKGSTYFIPEATSKINDQIIDVTVKAYYKDNETLKEVEIKDDKLKCDLIGEYQIIYSSTSDLYKTSLGNNTKSELVFKIISKVGASTLAKVEDINNILPTNFQLQTNILNKGEIFDDVSLKMKNTAENFQVFNIEIFNESGEKITPNNEIRIYLRVDDYFNRQEIEVKFLNEDGTLINKEVENYGRYISLNTSDVGTFIVYVPGVTFIMPIWGYILIAAAILIVLAIIIIIPILVKKKKIFVSKIKNQNNKI